MLGRSRGSNDGSGARRNSDAVRPPGSAPSNDDALTSSDQIGESVKRGAELAVS